MPFFAFPSSRVNAFLGEVRAYTSKHLPHPLSIELMPTGRYRFVYPLTYVGGVEDVSVVIDEEEVALLLERHAALHSRFPQWFSPPAIMLGNILIEIYFLLWATRGLKEVRDAIKEKHNVPKLYYTTLPALYNLAECCPIVFMIYYTNTNGGVNERGNLRVLEAFLSYITREKDLHIAQLSRTGKVKREFSVSVRDAHIKSEAIVSELGSFFLSAIKEKKLEGKEIVIPSFVSAELLRVCEGKGRVKPSFIPAELLQVYNECVIAPLAEFVSRFDVPAPRIEEKLHLPPIVVERAEIDRISVYNSLGFPLVIGRAPAAILPIVSLSLHPISFSGLPSSLNFGLLNTRSICALLFSYAVGMDFLRYYGNSIGMLQYRFQSGEGKGGERWAKASVYLQFKDVAQRALSQLGTPRIHSYIAPPAMRITFSTIEGEEERLNLTVEVDVSVASERVSQSLVIDIWDAMFTSFYEERQEDIPFWVRVLHILGALS